MGGGLAAMATGAGLPAIVVGGGGAAIATAGIPNAVGGTNWLEATCCCNKVSGKVVFVRFCRLLFGFGLTSGNHHARSPLPTAMDC